MKTCRYTTLFQKQLKFIHFCIVNGKSIRRVLKIKLILDINYPKVQYKMLLWFYFSAKNGSCWIKFQHDCIWTRMAIVFASRSITIMTQKTDSRGSLFQIHKATSHDSIQILSFKKHCFGCESIQVIQKTDLYIALLIFAYVNFRILPTVEGAEQ